MNAGTVINIVAVLTSVLSLTVSGALLIRQIRTARDGYTLPVVLDIFARFRSDGFFESEQHILNEVPKKFDAATAYTSVPMEDRVHLRKIAGLYDDLGKLVVHGAIREELVIGARGNSILRVWKAVAPLVYADRRQTGSALFMYLEDLACRVERTPPSKLQTKLKMMRDSSFVRFADDPETPDGPVPA